MTKKTKFGLSQMNKESPRWANISLNIVVATAAVGHIWVASTSLLENDCKVEIMRTIVVVQTFLHFIGNMCGIEIKELNFKQTKSLRKP